VSIVTREEIDTYGYRTLADVLRGVRGFYVTSDRNYSYLGVRGFLRPGDYNTRVLLLVDGHRLNDNIFDQAFIGTEFPVDVELIDRIEVVCGPSSSLYGDNAFFAVINVITRRTASLGQFSGSADGGSFGTARARATVAHSWGLGRQAVLSITGYRSHGASTLAFPELAGEAGGGVARDMDSDRAGNVFGSFTAGAWTVEGVWSLRDKQIPTGAYDTSLVDPRSKTRDMRAFLDLRHEGTWRGVATSWHVSYDRYDYDGTYASLQPDGRLDPNLFEDYGRGEWWTAEGSGTRRLGPNHVFSAGAEFRYDQRQDQGAGYEQGGLYLDDRRHTGHWGAYAQDEYRISRRVLVNAGVRFDHYPTWGDTANPRFALIFKPGEGQAIKALYGEAFRAPNAYEAYYYPSSSLEPEQIRTGEVAWERYFGHRLRLSASLFHSLARNLITETGSADTELDYAYVNAGESRVTGLGLEGETSLGSAMHVTANYTLAHPHPDDSGREPVNSPRHVGHVRAAVPVAGQRAIAAIETTLLSSRLTQYGSRVDPVALVNATVSDIRLAPGLLLAFDVKNLFDQVYADPGSAEHRQSAIPQDGRSVRARVTWGF
jgi:iron complex outermembrane receptor protein